MVHTVHTSVHIPIESWIAEGICAFTQLVVWCTQILLQHSKSWQNNQNDEPSTIRNTSWKLISQCLGATVTIAVVWHCSPKYDAINIISFLGYSTMVTATPSIWRQEKGRWVGFFSKGAQLVSHHKVNNFDCLPSSMNSLFTTTQRHHRSISNSLPK